MEGREVIGDAEDANQCVAGVQRVVSPPRECFWYFIVINVLTFPLVVVVQLVQRLFSFFFFPFTFLRLSINCTAGKKTPHTHTHTRIHTHTRTHKHSPQQQFSFLSTRLSHAYLSLLHSLYSNTARTYCKHVSYSKVNFKKLDASLLSRSLL